MEPPVKRGRYTADDLGSAIASLAIEGLIVTDEDIREVLGVLNGEMSREAYLHELFKTSPHRMHDVSTVHVPRFLRPY